MVGSSKISHQMDQIDKENSQIEVLLLIIGKSVFAGLVVARGIESLEDWYHISRWTMSSCHERQIICDGGSEYCAKQRYNR
jgi:hypothetical protein